VWGDNVAFSQVAEKVHLLRSWSSEILTYNTVRSGFLLPAALHLELFEQPVGFSALEKSC